MDTPTRKNSTPIKVYCLPTEKAIIEEKAQQAGMSCARYLREVGQGYRVKGIVDVEKVQDLAKINGDLGRMGGLLKMWLVHDPRTAHFDVNTIQALLKRIEQTQDEMSDVMNRIVMAQAQRK